MKGACPLTDAEVPPVCIQVPHSRDVYTSGGVHEIKRRDVDGERCFMIGDIGSDFEMVLPRMQPPLPPPSEDGQEEPPPLPQKTEADELVPPAQPPLYAERSLTGYGQERGGVQSILTNPSADTEVEFVYMESLPWFMRVYLHTIKVRVESIGDSAASGLAKPSRWQRLGSASPVGANASSSVIQEIYYRPAQDRARGTQLELRIRLPPASTAFLTYDFEKTILRYTEYPPDANRGFDVAAAVITVLDPSTSATGERRAVANLRTTALLLNLPTPDFSMPYNVIIFTSTTIALAFGGMFNIIVRRFVAADEGPELNVRALRKKVVGRLAILGQRVAARWKTRREGGQHEKVE